MNCSFGLCAFYLFILLLPVISHRIYNPRCSLPSLEPRYEYEYYKEGDVILAGLISAHHKMEIGYTFDEVEFLDLYCADVHIEKYRSFLSFIFAVDEVNKDPDLLPNITLGYHIVDTFGDSLKTSHAVFKILSRRCNKVPNYSSINDGEVVAFVVDSYAHAMLPLLNLYKYTQLSYGVGALIPSDRVLYPTSYKLSPDDQIRYMAVVKFLQSIGWNWVGLITTGEGSSEMEARELSKLMAEHEICIEYIINLGHEEKAMRQMSEIHKSTAEVLVICGPYSAKYSVFLKNYKEFIENVTLILHESWVVMTHVLLVRVANCSLIFQVTKRRILKVEESICNVNPSTRPHDPLLEKIWFRLFHCLTGDQERNMFYQWYYGYPGENCTETYYIPPTEYKNKDTNLYYTYVSVYILAKTLHKMKVTGDESSPYHLQQKLHKYMKYIYYTDPDGRDVYFDDRGNVPYDWYIANWIMFTNNGTIYYRETPIAAFLLSSDGKLDFYPVKPITWKNDQKPVSRCNEPCSPGYRKAPNGGYHVCCYDCVPCSEGEFSNITDSESCYKCPEEDWPDENKVKCVLKIYEFLSYEKDIMVHIFSTLALFFSAVTLFILRSFIYYWDTPIVKANNRTVSFILLVSILLSFLCVFFFLGRPVDITCLLRQISFGIFFAIGVSSILAKTITVCIAFKATIPGSSWLKWVTVKVSNSVIVVCSSVQVLICVLWLLLSPPYVEFDHHTYPGQIIIQCNAGSDIWFYSMLGYLGFLAAVSFVLAFVVRTLPDTFNEAKYITFSMLVFCSVWIAMVPAYLSTTGKYMVAVEIFAILMSCVGILGCIFFPKVYILYVNPNFNSRKVIMEKNKL